MAYYVYRKIKRYNGEMVKLNKFETFEEVEKFIIKSNTIKFKVESTFNDIINCNY